MRIVRMVIVLFGIIIAAFIGFSLYLYYAQDRMVFFPSKELIVTPDQVGLSFEDVWIEVEKNEKIHGWYFKSKTTDDAIAPTVLFFHGNGGNISHRLETITFLQNHNVNILIFDYRGYGQSDGFPNEENIYADARACYEWLINRKGCKPDEIVLFGRSLGGVVAVDLASRVTCRGLIVESSFTSAEAMAKNMFPFFPVSMLVRYRLDSDKKITQISCPVLIMHSPDDDIVPYKLGEQLYSLAKPPKKFVKLCGKHNELLFYNDDIYRTAIVQIITGEAKNW